MTVERQRPFFIGISGGSAGGKTTFVQLLQACARPRELTVICLDSYYRSQDHLPFEERTRTNYDHPQAFEFDLLLGHLKALRRGEGVRLPVYDFALHTRTDRQHQVTPTPIIAVEGVLALYHPELRALYDLRLFIDAPADLRLQRRVERDTRERGRSRESVLRQWEQTVHPMYVQYCEPARDGSDRVLSGVTLGRAEAEAVLSAARVRGAV